jgi:hypothetical protein
MATRKEMTIGGLYIAEATATNGYFETGVDLTGKSGQGARYVTASNTVVVTTIVTTGDSITLQAGDQGDWLQIVNYSANPLKVYPPVGWKIHNGSVNAAFTVGAAKSCTFSQMTDPSKPGGPTNEFFAVLSA